MKETLEKTTRRLMYGWTMLPIRGMTVRMLNIRLTSSALILNQISYDNISLASLDNDSAGIVVASYDDFSSEDGSDNGSIELRLRSDLMIISRSTLRSWQTICPLL